MIKLNIFWYKYTLIKRLLNLPSIGAGGVGEWDFFLQIRYSYFMQVNILHKKQQKCNVMKITRVLMPPVVDGEVIIS